MYYCNCYLVDYFIGLLHIRAAGKGGASKALSQYSRSGDKPLVKLLLHLIKVWGYNRGESPAVFKVGDRPLGKALQYSRSGNRPLVKALQYSRSGAKSPGESPAVFKVGDRPLVKVLQDSRSEDRSLVKVFQYSRSGG